MNHKKSITIHNLDEALAQLIEQRAREEGNSLNATIKKLLQESLGIPADTKYADFSKFCGGWTEEEFEEFQKNTEDMERIDPTEW